MTGEVRLRAARTTDLEALLRWRNDPVTCANFKARNPFTRHGMECWLDAALSGPGVSLRIAEQDEQDVGVLRVDADGAVLIIVAPEARGRGVAGGMLRHLPRMPLFAEIKETNMPSRRAFQRAGFRRAGIRFGMLVHVRP